MKRNLSYLDRLILLHSGFGMLAGWALLNMGTLFSLLFVPLARRDPSFAIGYAVLLMPIAGLILVFIHYRRNAASVSLLLVGQITKGSIVRAVKTGGEVKYKYVSYPEVDYSATFRNEDGQDQHLSVRTHQPIYEDDNKQVWVIYHPSRPTPATLYDSIPNAPMLLDDGRLSSLPFATIQVLILPAIFFTLFGRWVLVIVLRLFGFGIF